MYNRCTSSSSRRISRGSWACPELCAVSTIARSDAPISPIASIDSAAKLRRKFYSLMIRLKPSKVQRGQGDEHWMLIKEIVSERRLHFYGQGCAIIARAWSNIRFSLSTARCVYSTRDLSTTSIAAKCNSLIRDSKCVKHSISFKVFSSWWMNDKQLRSIEQPRCFWHKKLLKILFTNKRSSNLRHSTIDVTFMDFETFWEQLFTVNLANLPFKCRARSKSIQLE